MPREPISCNGSGATEEERLSRALRAGAANGRRSKEFHAWHCPQRPSHRGDSKPQAEQK
jgi:hypothetical protein